MLQSFIIALGLMLKEVLEWIFAFSIYLIMFAILLCCALIDLLFTKEGKKNVKLNRKNRK